MKNVYAILTVMLLSVSAVASEIKGSELDSYKAAAILAIGKANLKCTIAPVVQWRGITDLLGFIDRATSAVLNDSGDQPVLIFKDKSISWENSIAITTSVDFLTVVSVDFYSFSVSLQQVNLGTIVKPIIVTEAVKKPQYSASCK